MSEIIKVSPKSDNPFEKAWEVASELKRDAEKLLVAPVFIGLPKLEELIVKHTKYFEEVVNIWEAL